MSERLNGIEAFVAAVEAGNFASAAQRLRLTRSAVGKSVARLEERLGIRLFHRTTRSQSLTEDGLAYYERCRRALAELEAADAAIEAGRQEPRGVVRITMPELLGRTRIAPLLLELGQRHPELGFDVSFSDRSVDLVEEGFDLAIRSGPLGDSAMLVARRLGEQCMRVYAAPAYLEAHGGPDSVDALMANVERYAYVGYSRHNAPHPWQFHDANRRVLDLYVPARYGFSCNSLEVTVMAACQGMGLARLPGWLVADAVTEGRLVQVFTEPYPFGYALHAVWPQTRALPMKTRVVIDMLVERLAPLLAAGLPRDQASSSGR